VDRRPPVLNKKPTARVPQWEMTAPRCLMEPPNCRTLRWVQGAMDADNLERVLTLTDDRDDRLSLHPTPRAPRAIRDRLKTVGGVEARKSSVPQPSIPGGIFYGETIVHRQEDRQVRETVPNLIAPRRP
jgi:hypothetical protein